MAKRRRVLIGVGALVFGSGALTVNAAFSSSVNPTGDMRVVAKEGLVVEPGIMFRVGTEPDSDFDPNAVGSFEGVNVYDSSLTDFFGGVDNAGLSGINPGDVPAAAIDETVNGDITLQTAVGIGTTGRIGNGSNGVLQVRNTTGSARDIAIRYSSFGDDVDPDDVTQADVAGIFEFKSGDNTQISPDPSATTGKKSLGILDTPQVVANTVTVSPGGTVQIYMAYDTRGESIEQAIDTRGSPFDSSTDTVQLLEEIEIGTDPDSSNVSN